MKEIEPGIYQGSREEYEEGCKKLDELYERQKDEENQFIMFDNNLAYIPDELLPINSIPLEVWIKKDRIVSVQFKEIYDKANKKGYYYVEINADNGVKGYVKPGKAENIDECIDYCHDLTRELSGLKREDND